MEIKTFYSRHQQKHDKETSWKKAVNFVPLSGELVVYDIDDNYPYERLKIGDGETNVNDLPFVVDNIDMEEMTNEEIDLICGQTIVSLSEVEL